MKKTITLALFSLMLIASACTQEKPIIQIAILLDTSNSMDGLISQAKGNLWTIVNQFANAKREGIETQLEIALYEYGNDSLSARTGHIRQVTPFSTDLDNISEQLFRLDTNGGSEYCGMAIQQAINDLNWSTRSNDLRIVYIAGNETFNQGPVLYKSVCSWAAKKSIRVNTIHCGEREAGIRGFWQDAAKRGNGKYLNIDQNKAVDDIITPYDEKIHKLNSQLNETYIPYGNEGEAGVLRQSSQDSNASSMNSKVRTDRAITKSSKKYSNAKWDLVDAEQNDTVNIDELKDEELPSQLKGLSPEALKKIIDKTRADREKIQAEIQALSRERKDYIKNQNTEEKEESLDSAIIKSSKELGSESGFEFEE